MQTIESSAARRARAPAATTGPAAPAATGTAIAYVDCIDPARQDLLLHWLERAGVEVRQGQPLARGDDAAETGREVLLTDRFGPGLAGEVVIAAVKEGRPGLRVVVLGCGKGDEATQLSLARVAGADATLASPMERDAVLALVEFDA